MSGKCRVAETVREDGVEATWGRDLQFSLQQGDGVGFAEESRGGGAAMQWLYALLHAATPRELDGGSNVGFSTGSRCLQN